MKNKSREIEPIEFFSKTSRAYEEAVHHRSLGLKHLSNIETDFVKKTMHNLHEGINCLEIGAGTGRFTEILLKNKYKIEIIEAAHGMVDILKSKFIEGNINIKNIDAGNNFPYPSNYFNYVLAMRVLKYIPKWKATIAEVHRVLIPGEYFVFSISNIYSVAYFKGDAKYFLFKPKDVINYLENLGFDVVKISATTRLSFLLYLKINSHFFLNLIIYFEKFLDQIFPYWLFSRAILICAEKRK